MIVNNDIKKKINKLVKKELVNENFSYDEIDKILNSKFMFYF